MAGKAHVVVVGAGAFGGWTALHLRRAGHRVTLLDSWGPGNARSGSGGATRVLRAGYGASAHYCRMARRARERWLAEEPRLGARLYREIGVLWLVGEEDAYIEATLANLRDQDVPLELLQRDVAALRWPQISTAGVRSGFLEPEAGYLLAAEACRRVADAFVAEGGELLHAEARPGRQRDGKLAEVELTDQGTLGGDQFVFACGAWLPQLFPGLLGGRVMVSRQEVFFFGTPPGDPRWEEGALPAWVDYGEAFWYGIPGNGGRGFKLADDTRGPRLDPTTAERFPDRAGAAAAAAQLSHRFPALDGAPLLDARVCQYANNAEGFDFLCERHPDWPNVLLLGGGSGHGFKHGPVVGEEAARLLAG